MKTLSRCLAVAIVAAAFFAINQRRQITTTRAEMERLKVRQDVQFAKAVPAASVSKVTARDIERLRDENRDIHKLRGQIYQAREKRRAFEKMQAENAQLKKRIAEVKANPDAAQADPFPLSNKGQSTPEAAVETMFWSMYQGDFESLSRIIPVMTRDFEKQPPQEKTNNIIVLRAMASTIGQFEITDRKFPSPDEAHLEVRIQQREGADRSPFSDKDQRFVLRRTNNVWQIVSQW